MASKIHKRRCRQCGSKGTPLDESYYRYQRGDRPKTQQYHLIAKTERMVYGRPQGYLLCETCNQEASS